MQKNNEKELHLKSQVPPGELSNKWTYKFNMKLVNPSNKRKYTVIVVGTGLAGASAAATMAELGYNVLAFSYHESPRQHIVLLLKEELMQLKIIKMMEIVCIVCFMILLRVVIIDRVKQMYIVWQS